MKHILKFIIILSLFFCFTWYQFREKSSLDLLSEDEKWKHLNIPDYRLDWHAPCERAPLYVRNDPNFKCSKPTIMSQVDIPDIDLTTLPNKSVLTLPRNPHQFNIQNNNFVQKSKLNIPNENYSKNIITSSNQTISLPIFVKLHVVGSSTLVNILRCLIHSNKKDGDLDSSNNVLYQKIGNKGYSLGSSYWNHKQCGQEQGHETIVAFAQGGISSLICCLDDSPIIKLKTHLKVNVQFVTLIRNPIEKYISSIFTFASGGIKEMLLKTPARDITVDFLEKASMNVWGEEPSVLARSSARIKNRRAHDRRLLNMLVRGTRREIKEVFQTKERMNEFHLIGITEEFNKFLVLLSIEFDWPLSSTCYQEKLHANSKRPPTSSFNPEVIRNISIYLQHDLILYNHGKKINHAQINKHEDFDKKFTEWESICGIGINKYQDSIKDTSRRKNEGVQKICATQSKHTKSLDGKYRCSKDMQKYIK